ncbi:class I SAM-dependent methyltransferase [Candidatus Symbiobacter mobilis]|uniref:SAM-dependent methyltransferase n=1 Tax=Candidatus Symbiobacter mobilis CR TaxID=946483 RepID=U5N7B1_9BURK|nr:class I SAM-dependent methyltransferase [Candidatus Symbiobacter mobilis]AGX86183.1 SAM-dependent methyltransferase [Candidatus Symbiobacter mobilis CR]
MAKTGPFDQYTDRYDYWFDRNQEIYLAELEAIRRAMPPHPVKGLEVGVGSGKFAAPFGIQIGVEPSANMACKAERLGISVFRNVAEHLPFADMEFEMVLMVATICFVDNVLASFQEAFRVLQPHGCMIVGFVDKESALGKKYIDHSTTSVFYKDATFFSVPEVVRYLTDAGFVDLTFQQTLIPGAKQGKVEDGWGQGAFVVAKGVKG